MTQFAMRGPLDETDLDHDLRLNPVRAQTRQAGPFCERRFRNLELVQLRAQIEQQFGIESGSDSAGENEITVFVMTDEKRTESNALALRIRKTTDDKLRRQLALHLQPLL